MDEEWWPADLDASLAESLKEMEAGGGRDLDEICDEIIVDIGTAIDTKQH